MRREERLVLATNNQHKVREIRAILGDRFGDIVTMGEAGLELEVEETGQTFEENAVLKARAVAQATGCWALADDSGICADALGGAPGVWSARYSGLEKDDQANNDKLILELAGKEDRSAHYACVIALAGPGGEVLTAEGLCEGQIGFEPKGTRGFGYDPYFIPAGSERTMAELTDDEKNAISHRKRALEGLLAKLERE